MMVRTLVMFSLVAGASAGAQSSAKPRVGYAASPTPPPAAPQPAPQGSPYYYVPGGYVVTGAPYVVLSDGSVAVNFGYGYERVLRPCAPAPQQQTASTGRDALGRILPPPGIAALQAGSRGQIVGSAPARNASACYRAGPNGRLEMGR